MRLKIRNPAILALVASATVSTEVAKASMVISASVTPNVTFANGTYDQVNFNLTALTGVDNKLGPSGQEAQVVLMSGVFTATGSVGVPQLGVPGDPNAGAGNWQHFVNNVATPPVGYAASFANFQNALGPARNGTGTSDQATSHPPSAITGNSISFGASWVASASPAVGPDPIDNPLVASVLVTPGDGITLRGKYATYGNTGNDSPFAISYVPGFGVRVLPNNILVLDSLADGPELGSTLGTNSGDPILELSTQPASVNNINKGLGVSAGSLTMDGFKPSAGPEIFALKLKVGGSVPTPAQMSTIINDINTANIGVTALLPTPDIASVFPGYELELTDNSTTLVSTAENLSFDFGQETNVFGIVVTDIGEIPEPASIVGALAFSASLLLGRRRFVRAKR